MYKKAYGTPTPDTYSRLSGKASSLDFYKKAISYYMPQKNEVWDPVEGKGNPTKSQEVRELMQKVREAEGVNDIKKGDNKNNDNQTQQEIVGSDMALRGILLKMHAQNAQFINMFQHFSNSLSALNDSMEQMRSSLMSNNIAIMSEISNINENSSLSSSTPQPNNIHQHSNPPQASAVDATGTTADDAPVGMDDEVHVTSITNMSALGDVTVKPDPDGYCSFQYENGVLMVVPEDFDFPSCYLFEAWKIWLIGFPDHKIQTKEYGLIHAPIRPLRMVGLRSLPASLKKKFKDGWKPILQSMCADIKESLDRTPVLEQDSQFVVDAYNVALSSIKAKSPTLFENEKWQTWRVATWSRKIREEDRKRKINDEDGIGSDVEEI